MTRTKEKIKTIVHNADGTVAHTTERMGTVYKKKDGREWAHHGQGYLLVTREENLAVVHHHPSTAAAVASVAAATAPVATA